jgi:hypothetical protein
MPRYFFHASTQDRLIWDATGLELPEIGSLEDPELTSVLWSEVLDRQFQKGRAFVITDAVGKVLFVMAR